MLSVSSDWLKQGETVVVSYEKLVADTIGELESLAKKIGHVAADVKDVVEQHQFEKLALTQDNNHFWKGTPVHWRDMLEPETVQAIAPALRDQFEATGFEFPLAETVSSEVDKR